MRKIIYRVDDFFIQIYDGSLWLRHDRCGGRQGSYSPAASIIFRKLNSVCAHCSELIPEKVVERFITLKVLQERGNG